MSPFDTGIFCYFNRKLHAEFVSVRLVLQQRAVRREAVDMVEVGAKVAGVVEWHTARIGEKVGDKVGKLDAICVCNRNDILARRDENVVGESLRGAIQTPATTKGWHA